MADEQTQTTQQSLSRSIVEKLVIMALFFGLVGGVAGGWVWQHLAPQSVTSKALVVQENSAVVAAAKKVSPSVVSITTREVADSFFGAQEISGAGTGMIVTSDGLILTNKHVVPAGTQSVTVFTDDGKQHKGKVVARDPSNDLALVKIDAKGLKAIQLGDSSKTEIGQKVIAIGNALGQFENTVTDGIISGLGRPIEAGDELGSSESLQNLFQTDAAINPGNSGGPLVDVDGRVLGINTAVAGGAQNIGFAIPINEAKPVIDSYKRSGKIIRPFLGVRFVPITKEFAAARNLPVSEGAYLDPNGANPVVSGSPAAKAGLRAGDIITKVAGDSIDERSSLTTLIAQHQVGETVNLTIVRDRKTQTVKVTLAEAPTN